MEFYQSSDLDPVTITSRVAGTVSGGAVVSTFYTTPWGVTTPPDPQPGGGPVLANPIADQFYRGNAAPVVVTPIGIQLYSPA